MAKQFKDFIYRNKSLSDLQTKFVSVDFEASGEMPFAMSREIQYGDTNKYRTEPNVSGSSFSEKLKFELHIVKDNCIYPTQSKLEITEPELRDLSRWLTSTDSSNWLKFENITGDTNETTRYYGQFQDIQKWAVGGAVYGLKLIFECSSAFGYTDDIVNTVVCHGSKEISIINDSDEENRYCYPSIKIDSNITGQIYLCNMSDCFIYDEGTLVATSTNKLRMALLQEKVNSYGVNHGLAVEFKFDEIIKDKLITIGNDTAVQFRFVDSDSNKHKCIAYYIESTGLYKIIRGGFLYLNINRSLPVHMDSQKLTLVDDLGRMIKFSTIGVEDMDYMYWLRLKSGINTLLFYGEACIFTVSHNDTRKVGA